MSDTGSINSRSLGYLSPSFEVVISAHQPVIPNLKMKLILFAWFISFSAATLASPNPVPAPSTNDTCLAEGVGCKFIAYGINYPLGTCCSPLTCTGFTELDSTFLVSSNMTLLTSYFALSLMSLHCRLVRSQKLSLCDDEHGSFSNACTNQTWTTYVNSLGFASFHILKTSLRVPLAFKFISTAMYILFSPQCSRVERRVRTTCYF